MKRIHLFSLLALIALSAGCILVSGQFIVDFEIPDKTIVNDSDVYREDIDLNEESVYADHREDIETASDLALIGKLKNTGGTNINVTAYITPSTTNYTDGDTVRTKAIQVWGPFQVAVGAEETVGWDASAALFSESGTQTLIFEVVNDGKFTLYILAAEGTYEFSVTQGSLVVVLDAGA